MMLRILLSLALLLGGSITLTAQEAPDQQMSPEEAEQLMNSIAEKMRDLEQMLAKASLAPQDLSMLIEQLKEAAAENDFEHLPRSLREFLLNNPDLLAKLKNPDADGDSLLQTEDEIRRLLATKDDGLEQLLRENPEMLERLLTQEGAMEEALQEHSNLENNLQRLFDQTSQQMESTEGDIEKLMDLAQQMQQQMNQQAEQQKQDQLNQENQPQPGERQTENEGAENSNGQEENPNGSPEAGSPRGLGGQEDPNAWDMILPRSERERGTTPGTQPTPRGYEAETARYFRLLAQQARKERERQERREREGR